ncbi:MAG TPA: MBOAT family O-acyltransferase [Alphaproteobacteria bacterium]|nr:MBOAT family O-acyltransferase [Alphaproteobacteria bacterium]
MVFSSVVFLFYFLPAFFLLYYLLPWKNTVLLVASLLFYGWGEPRYLPLLLFVIVLNYGFGLIVGEGRHRRALMILGVAVNLGLLAYYKYFGFLGAQLDLLLPKLGISPLPLPKIALPLGISFFTFQGISYLVDVYWGQVAAQRSLLKYATYKAMFPQLVAGPIVRYAQVADAMDNRQVDAARLEGGIKLFAMGLGQKVLIANTIAAPVDQIFAFPTSSLTPEVAWLGAIGYGLQVYFDFCGYSNMAIGMGHMMGFTFPRNFNRPYAARSMIEFWSRWHITLTRFLTIYVYNPIVLARTRARLAKGLPLLTGRNATPGAFASLLMMPTLFMMLLSGLWHGAGYTFIAWGLSHGIFLTINHAWRLIRPRFWPDTASYNRRMAPLAYALTIVALAITLVFFRSDTIGHALRHLAAMFRPGGDHELMALTRFVSPSVAVALVVGAALAVLPLPEIDPTARPVPASVAAPLGWRTAMSAFCLALVGLSAVSLAAGTYNPFIYFRF